MLFSNNGIKILVLKNSTLHFEVRTCILFNFYLLLFIMESFSFLGYIVKNIYEIPSLLTKAAIHTSLLRLGLSGAKDVPWETFSLAAARLN